MYFFCSKSERDTHTCTHTCTCIINAFINLHVYLASSLNKYKMHAVNKRVKYYYFIYYYHFVVPDDMVMKVLSGRLSQLDCATRGWVLHGFPLTREQAELLDEHGYEPYR